MTAKKTVPTPIIDRLLESDEPSIRWKVRHRVLGEPADSPAIQELQAEIRRSPRVLSLLEGAQPSLESGRVYNKWEGAHWVLAALADLGYPPGDQALAGLRDRVMDQWVSPVYLNEFVASSEAEAYRDRGVPVMQGRHRRCASQQGNALFAATRLGLADERAVQLAERLMHWQWPDGGWNCDRNPSADTSSFMETLTPMCGLFVHARATGDAAAAAAANRAAEVFLERNLFRRRSDGTVIHHSFIDLHYPLYWHYDYLGGLKAMALLGRLDDPRCAEALDLLETRRLPDGGWPADKRYYKVASSPGPAVERVGWGPTGSQMNPWVTADALAVLAAAGRLNA